MSRKVRPIAAVLLAAMVWAGLSSCLEHPFHHSRREVVAYLEENFPGEDITVSRDYTEEPDKDYDRTVRTWDCWFADLLDAVFTAGSAWGTGPSAPGYSVLCDEDEVLWRYHLDQYLTGAGSLDTWSVDAGGAGLAYGHGCLAGRGAATAARGRSAASRTASG